MEANFSRRVKDVITFSREEALRLGHDYIGTEHFLLGIIREGEGTAIRILKSLHVQVPELRKMIEQSIAVDSTKANVSGNIPLVKQAEKTLKITYLEAKLFKSNTIGTEHLLLSILKDDNNVGSRALRHFNVNYDMVKDELENMADDERHFPNSPDVRSEFPSSPADDESDGEDEFSGASKKPVDPKSKTPVLDNFGRDLTRMADEGKLDPIVGRAEEIERVSQILSRRKKTTLF